MREKLTTFMIIQLIFVFLAAVAFAAPGDGGGDGVGDGEGNPDAKRPGMFRKNVSRTPEMTSTKSKLNTMRVWFPALRADGNSTTYKDDANVTQLGIPYYDYTCVETNATGECLDWERNLIRVAEEAKPIVVVYTDAVEETGCEDVFAAVSRDDGKTFKRKNLSRMADKSSFTLANGEECYGQVKKPVFQICGNNILVAWTSKFCKGGKPTYAIDVEDDYFSDDPYWEDDIYGVAGPQRSVDYTEGTGPIADYPEVGEVPYSCVWVVRGTIVTQGMIDSGADGGFWGQYEVGDIIWFKPERLTSGRRDAIQAFMGMGDGAGFGVTWQEDPAGLRPGKMAGPGHGWSGATVHHKTDVWYSFMTQADFRRIDTDYVSGGEGVHDSDNYIADRPKALVPMPLPVRISDNDIVNTDSMQVELYDNGYPIVHTNGNFIPLDGGSSITEVFYEEQNLTRCVKFEGGKKIVEIDSGETDADYYVLRPLPADHQSNMNCTNCHVPYGTNSTHDALEQGSPIPLVVVDAATPEYLGGFTNSDCVSCHYTHVVPRDRVISVAPGTDEGVKCTECENNGGIWKDGTQVGDDEIIEAYYPYDGYPYIAGADDSSGTHRYGYMLPEMCDTYKQSVLDNGGNATTEPNWDNVLLSNWYDFVNNQEVAKRVLVTDDSRLLDGDTGASRPNLFLKPFTNNNGTPNDPT
ncbi:MAG: hypothetical protein K8R75_05335, partial [Deltaproteobacteria bacterium]|nr:hypothetical protein [Deltaproteobacteria bacterium]